ncbi:hypothetical protein [Desulfosporosinus shakirovi]|uniref:hypothetical protein n=1 Tax=Desulfosporosinus shakirovi TaxID=2885154 RepID=UPI001E2A1992|nr:hypothetical protein [Desulfosporosinus sp. SRJS8]MCB8818612.1 hypothetical protein [Desulfosporosinus sp. SRJS8]
MINFWEVKCRRGAWRGKVYILASTEWEAGKQTETALEQLDLIAEVVGVKNFSCVSYKDIQDTSTVAENQCVLCNQLVDGPISRRTVLSPKTDIPLLGTVRILGEICTRTCIGCGKLEEWQTNFGYIPEIWFSEKARIIPFVGKFLRSSKEVTAT